MKHSSDLRMPAHNKSREAYLSIWDTAGQERYHSLGPIYYRNANGAILVFDITDTSSFERVQKWVKELRKMVGDRNKICLIIVGNKADLSLQRSVDAEEAASYAKSVHAAYLEASAKTGSGVEGERTAYLYMYNCSISSLDCNYRRHLYQINNR